MAHSIILGPNDVDFAIEVLSKCLHDERWRLQGNSINNKVKVRQLITALQHRDPPFIASEAEGDTLIWALNYFNGSNQSVWRQNQDEQFIDRVNQFRHQLQGRFIPMTFGP